MLKLLLGHWKAHRKKPSLLPEDGDVHFEEPSTINPLFEDSDSSISSSKKSVSSKRNEQNQSTSQEENDQSLDKSNEHLETQTNFQVVSEQQKIKTNEEIQSLTDSQVVTDQVTADATTVKTFSETLIPIQSKDSEISNISLSTKEKIETNTTEESLNAVKIQDSKNLGEEKPINEHDTNIPAKNSVALEAKSHKEHNSEISPKDESKESDAKSEENMRLYNQPSTSAITETKKRFSETSNGIEKTHISDSKSPIALKINKQENNRNNASTRNGSELDIDKSSNKPTSSLFKHVTDNSVTVKSVQQSNDEEKPAKLKAKAIDELIKKFQSPKTENDKNENNVTKADKKNSINRSTGTKTFTDKEVKTESVNTSSPPTNTSKDGSNVIKPERKNLSKANETKIQSDIPKKTTQEIEALSNIFKFPPPPPLEQLENKSSLHGKILKDRKIDPLSRTSKVNENENISKEIESGKTRSDSSLDRTRTASSSKLSNDVKADINDTKQSTSTTDKQNIIKSTEIKSADSDPSIKEVFPNSNEEKVKIKANVSSLHTKNASAINLPTSKDDSRKENTKETKTVESSSILSQNDTKKSESLVSGPKVTESISQFSRKEINNKQSPVSGPKVIDSASQLSRNDSKKNELLVSSPKTELPSHQLQNDPRKKTSPVSNRKLEMPSNPVAKSTASTSKNSQKSPVPMHKSSISKATAKLDAVIENENMKLHSEDSGITRGDQISSETTQEPPTNDLPEQAKTVRNSLRKNKKEKKLKSSNKKVCKHCRHAHNDSVSIKRSPCDEYYDELTGIKLHKNRHSDSWTSDLSWEERELLRRLRSRRGTIRSNAPSTRSRLSKHRFIDENYFRRHHHFRRSLSDESSFYGGSLCSCDECWAMYLKEYAYGRASLRGMTPIQEICTCRNSHHNFLGRRVQFRPDIIHEASPSERTATTPAPSLEKKKQNDDDDDDDKNSQKSSKSKGADSISTHPDGHKEKKTKKSEDFYRIVSPWELEELNLLMRKHLLKKRRRRARCMGIMALAMVVFLGLIVAIVMVYLRRKTL